MNPRCALLRAPGQNAEPDLRVQRGSVVYIRDAGDYWELINKPQAQAA